MASNAKNLAEYLNNQTTSATADIADGSITTDKLAADAVTAAKLADNAVVTANITDSAVTDVKRGITGINAQYLIVGGGASGASGGGGAGGLLSNFGSNPLRLAVGKVYNIIIGAVKGSEVL